MIVFIFAFTDMTTFDSFTHPIFVDFFDTYCLDYDDDDDDDEDDDE